MKKKAKYTNLADGQKELNEFPDYPLYPKGDDIYKRSKEEQDIDPEDITQLKETRKRSRYSEVIEPNYIEDLDVPGAELDDEDEKIGSEDEENNYYSLGGDEHDDLEENKGD